MATPQIALTAARNSGAVVTVVIADGRARTGVVHESYAGGPNPVYVESDGAQHRMYFHPEDVIAVVPATP